MIRTIFKLTILILAIGSAVPIARAQCMQYQAEQLTCGGPNNCQQTVAVNLPYSAYYGINMSYFLVACCNTSFPSYYPVGGVCPPGGDAALKNPEVTRAIFDLAVSETIMLADCKGQFHPYHISLDSGPSPLDAPRKSKIWN